MGRALNVLSTCLGTDFEIDDWVRWFKADSSVPKGSVGQVVGFTDDSRTKLFVAWPSQTYFAMRPAELGLFASQLHPEDRIVLMVSSVLPLPFPSSVVDGIMT